DPLHRLDEQPLLPIIKGLGEGAKHQELELHGKLAVELALGIKGDGAVGGEHGKNVVKGLGDAEGVAEGIFKLGIDQVQRDVGGLVIGKMDAQLPLDELQGIFSQGELPWIEGAHLRQQGVLKDRAIAAALNGEADMVGEGEVHAGAELLPQVLGGLIHDAAAELNLLRSEEHTSELQSR